MEVSIQLPRTAPRLGTENSNQFDRRPSRPQRMSGRCGEGKDLFDMLQINTQFLDCPTPCQFSSEVFSIAAEHAGRT